MTGPHFYPAQSLHIIMQTMGQSPSFANYRYHSQFNLKLPKTSSNLTASDWVEWISQIHEDTRKLVQKEKTDHRSYADQNNQQDPTYSVGQEVWLLTEHLYTDTSSSKLDYQFLSLYRIQ